MKVFLIKIITGVFLISFMFSPFVWAAETAGITVTVTLVQLEIIEATVEFGPEIIRPRQRFLRCYIELTEPFKVEDIDINTVALTEVNGDAIEPPLATAGPSKIGDYDRDGVADLQIRFNISSLIPILETGENSLTVSGNMVDGRKFKGTGTVSVIGTNRR
ncbi:MAG: hypothetical protein H8D67_03150 [Deltaproteobacteria bacterium]|nr:hypothetical protein [Deltaproteobacteria bacterium]MBL7174699.1 hypothetical protein [Desulfobacteraceae bacterium]